MRYVMHTVKWIVILVMFFWMLSGISNCIGNIDKERERLEVHVGKYITVNHVELQIVGLSWELGDGDYELSNDTEVSIEFVENYFEKNKY